MKTVAFNISCYGSWSFFVKSFKWTIIQVEGHSLWMLLFCYSIWSFKIYDGKNKYFTRPKWNWVDTNYKRLQIIIKSLPFSQFRKLLSWLKSLLNFNRISAVNKVQGLYNRPLLINVILRDAKGPRIFPLDYGVMDKAETWAEIGQDDMEPLNKKHWYNTSACAITLSAHWTVFNSIYRPFTLWISESFLHSG